MVNKPHAPRSSKKPASSAANLNGEDTSFIVFGDGKPKKSRPAATATDAPPAAVGKDKGKAKDAPPEAGQLEAEKKPDTRTLIAGSSWTGKLPMTLFNEHCQKQRWEKPEYTTHRTPKGFTGGVIIKKKDVKGQGVTILPPILLPKEYSQEQGAQPSAIEARHFAATYALYRVSNMKNIHMMLPPQYRDLWKGDFADLKSEAVAQGQGYLYEADPFAAKRVHDDAKVAREKARANKMKAVEDDKKSQVVSLDGQVQGKHVLRGWQRVPKVEMGARSRREVERLVREQGVWNSHAVKLNGKVTRRITDDLSNIGFRRSHVEEATHICKDREECLEWLLIHVPEDDLPKWTLPENYSAGVSLASGDLKREGKIKRLGASGYASEVCAETLDGCRGDEGKAAEALQIRLLGSDAESFLDTTGPSLEAWNEEQETLAAIYGDRHVKHDQLCTITLELQTPSKKSIVLRARLPITCYPNAVPVLSIEADLPAYIRLSVLKKCLNHARDSLLGEQMLFNIVDWLENEIPGIIDKPGRLSEIAGAASTFTEATSRPNLAAKRTKRHPTAITWTANTPDSKNLLSQWTLKQAAPEQQRMLQTRRNLPAWKLQDAIVASLTKNQVTIISGETGSGKSTQSVQFILDDLINRGLGEHVNIVCTQPRRISALGLADRVADERCGRVGDEVGYTIRGESKQKPGTTKICFVTTGVLLRRLQTSGGSADDVLRSLADVSHVVIDEVHERSLDTDFLLVLIRDVLKKRKDLKLVLMSATLDSATFESYFAGSSTVGKVEIEGRTHPVTDIYLDDILHATGFSGMAADHEADSAIDSPAVEHDPRMGPKLDSKALGSALRAIGTRINYDLVAQTVRLIDNQLGNADGGILIFLPGVAEIDQTLRALRSMPNLHALPLHASLQSSEQRRVFQKAPIGMRKVIAATNVAETSITIEDIVAVIDTGRVKETSFDPANNMVKLAEVWASRAACKQRRGRAGRVRAGQCYKLYTRSAEMKMAERPEPEIRRVPLEQLCLSVKAMGVADVPSFLASALTPPESLAVDGALKLLGRIGALDGVELTALGRHLSMIPADLRCGKLMVYGAAFGCLEACLTVAAVLTVKSPFVSPQTKREESKAARAAFGDNQGDLLCDLRAYEEWSERRSAGEPTSLTRRWCDENFLNHQTLMDISTNRTQYLSSLKETGFLPITYHSTSSTSDSYNRHNSNNALLRALVAGAFQPQVARIDFPDKKYAASSSGAVELDPEARTIKYFNEDNGRVFVHPSSTIFDASGFPGNSAYMSYFTKMATSKVFIRDLTPFNVYSLLMFSGPIGIDPQGRGLLVDGWLRLRGWARIGVLVSRLRMMLDELLARKIDEPALDLGASEVVLVVKKLVELDGLDR
jgi:ATP-dependent RNA helicase DHX57